jgi:hypothetical protein
MNMNFDTAEAGYELDTDIAYWAMGYTGVGFVRATGETFSDQGPVPRFSRDVQAARMVAERYGLPSHLSPLEICRIAGRLALERVG